jgi:hypothetical protein
VEGFYLELIGKFLSYQDVEVKTIIKTRQASHGLIMTRQKGHWKNDVHKKQGGEKELTLLDVDMCKWQRMIRGPNEVLIIGLHMVEKMSMGLDLESSKNP